MMSGKLLFLALILYAFCIQRNGYAQDILQVKNRNLVVRNWTIKDGLPSNSIRQIDKTTDGRLIIGSYNGISLFDGKSFTNFSSANLKFLKSSAFYDFSTDKDSTIWIASPNGLFAYDGNEFFIPKGVESLSNIAVESILFDKKGMLWIGTTSDGLYKYFKGKIEKISQLKGLEKNIISLLFEDKSGNIWIGDEYGNLYRYNGKNYLKISNTPKTSGIMAAQQLKSGDIYFGARDGIYLFRNNELKLFSDDINSINDLKADKNDILWVATNAGLFYLDKETKEFKTITSSSDFKKHIIQTIFFDNNNLMWVGSYRKGLFHFRFGAFENFQISEFDQIPSAIAEMANGKLWVSTDEGGIFELDNQGFRPIKIKNNLSGGRIKAICNDSRGNTWICSYKGLLKIKGFEETFFGASSGFPDITFRGLQETSDGNYWVGTRQSGLYKLSPELKILKSINTSNGLSSNFVMSIVKGLDEKMLVATKRGIDILLNDSIIKHYNTNDGLSENMVYNIYEDIDGTLWIATISGLSILKDGVFTIYNSKRGLVDDKIFDVIEDDDGYLWLPTVNGVIRVNKAALSGLSDPNVQVSSSLYGKTDGMFDPQYVGATKMLKLSNGKIALNTLSGISLLNPSVIDLYPSDYSLLIKSLSTENDTFYTNTENIKLPPSTRYVQINFAFVDFINPDKVEFKYKLVPFDNEWQTSGTDRYVKYTNLPPGEYTFHVNAIVKSKSNTILQKAVNFELKPAFFETVYFNMIIIATLLLLIWLTYIIRIKTIKKQKELLEYEVVDRTKEILKQKEAIESHLVELEKQKSEIDFKNEEILIATSNMEQAYLNLKLLSDLGKEITSYLNMEQIMSAVYKHINNHMDSDLVSIGIFNWQNKTIKFDTAYYRGKKSEAIESTTDDKNCILSYALVHDKEIITNDIKSDYPQFINTFPKLSTFKAIISLIAIPIKTKNKVTGVLTVQSFRRNSYSEYHFNLLRNLAIYVRIALENSKTYQELNQQKEELQKVNTAKDKMFSIIGHDLRSPVGTIKSFLDLLIENPEMTNTENTMHILKTMQQSLGSAYTLLDNLLLWARNQRGQIEFNPVAFNIAEPIEESINLVNESSKSKNIKVYTEIEYNENVFGDKVMITTVLRNLISNSIKFTPSNGEIKIVAKKLVNKKENDQNELVEIEVIDNGIGVKDEDIEKILKTNEMFTTPGTDKEQGSGLGISICLDFLAKHNKELIIEKNNGSNGKPSIGSTFKFYLDKA